MFYNFLKAGMIDDQSFVVDYCFQIKYWKLTSNASTDLFSYFYYIYLAQN